jgi:hypothetical protein
MMPTISSQKKPEVAVELSEAGIGAHLVKPISVDHLRIHLDGLMAAKSR